MPTLPPELTGGSEIPCALFQRLADTLSYAA